MTGEIHPLLSRLLRKQGLSGAQPPGDEASWGAFLRRLSGVLHQADEDRYTQERAVDVVSEEMRQLHDDLRAATASQLAQERDLLHAVMTAMGDGVCVLDAAGTIIFVNDEAERLLRAEPGSLLGGRGSDFVSARVESFSFEALRRGEACRGTDARARRLDGTDFPAGYALAPVLRDGGLVAVVIVFRDVTEQETASAALREARDAALEAARVKSEFVANVSHELRTPLNGIIGMTDLLVRSDLGERQRQYARTVLTCSDTLLRLINDLLDFSALEAGRLQIRPAAFDLRAELARVASVLEHAAGANGVSIERRVDPSIPDRIVADEQRISQVVLNLASNAVKFTRDGEVRLHATAEPRTDGDLELRIEVEDDGIGLAAEHHDLVFEPFRQVDGSSTRRYGGTGLGLSISRRLVEAMGGRIGVRSRPAGGTTFWFSVPVTVDGAGLRVGRGAPTCCPR